MLKGFGEGGSITFEGSDSSETKDGADGDKKSACETECQLHLRAGENNCKHNYSYHQHALAKHPQAAPLDKSGARPIALQLPGYPTQGDRSQASRGSFRFANHRKNGRGGNGKKK